MNRRNIIIALLVAAVALPAAAQKRKQTRKQQPKEQPVVVVEETPQERMFKTMLSSTAKVMFIDSIVVDKAAFLNSIPLSSEAGTISTYTKFFNKKTQVPLSVYLNAFGDRCYYAYGDTLGTALYSIDRLGKQWSPPHELTEFGEEYQLANYPFLQSDGATLFFAAKGKHSLGGYDIFMTRYDSEEDRFYRPENYGLPFNSTANDYMIAFDDVNELGFLVSDRYQSDDKVCIYTFVPTSPRQNFEGDDLSDEQLKQFARLTSISDTWAFGDRKAAMSRYQQTLSSTAQQKKSDAFAFIVDDQTTYRQLSDFHTPVARELFKKYAELTASIDTDERTLTMQRDKYASATGRDQRLMREAILRLEHQLYENREKAISMAKEIRKLEIENKQ